MSIQSYISINWDSSPRIITVAAPEVECSMQDLFDTVSYLEAQPENMDNPYIVDAAGKEDLGGGVRVGLTISLHNAQLAFEARTGPNYVQCNVSGGNLVALDTAGQTISPISPTAFTQIVLANSSSATLQEQSAIQYSSYGDQVTIDEVDGIAGTEYPVGTPRQPVDNVYDMITIATERGFTRGYVKGDLNVPDDPNFQAWKFTLEGQGKDRTVIDIPSSVTVLDCEFINAEITGYLDGNSRLYSCLVRDLHYIKGFIEMCVLAPGTIYLAGSDEAHFLKCSSGVPGSTTPVIDLGGTGQALAIRDYNGGVALQNKTGPESVSIDMNSGQIKIDMNTVTNGEIVCRGNGKLIDSNSGAVIPTGVYGNLIILNELFNVPATADAVWNGIDLVKP